MLQVTERLLHQVPWRRVWDPYLSVMKVHSIHRQLFHILQEVHFSLRWRHPSEERQRNFQTLNWPL